VLRAVGASSGRQGKGARFGIVRFDHAQFRGNAEFFGAEFRWAAFAGDAVLGANFTERAVFDGAWMRGPGSSPACWTLSTTRGVRWPDAEGEWRLLVRKPVAPGPEPDGTAAAEPVQS
jgi:hypothetical protein